MTFANRLKIRRLSNFDNDLPTLLIALHKYWCKTCQHVKPPLLFTHSAVHWYAAVREQSVCPYSGNDMPPAKVFHQKPGWLKAEGKQIFRLSECLRHNFFWSIAPAHFYVEDNCRHIYFSLPISSLPPKKHDIFGDGATVFYKLANSPIDVSVPTPILPPDMYAAFIYSAPTHACRCMCTQAHAWHQRARIILTRIHIFVNTALDRRHPH